MEIYAQINRVPIIRDQGAKLLIETVKMYKPLSILEIGTAIGYSTALMAIHSPKAKITTIEINEERAKQASKFLTQAGLAEQVVLILGDAGDVITKLNGCFDMVFIDGAKGQYLNYLKQLVGKLSPGAVIFADNVLFRGMVEGVKETPRRYRTIVNRLRDFLSFIKDDPRFLTVLHRGGDGVAISIYQGASDN